LKRKKSSLVSLKKQLKNFKVRVVWDADLIDFSKKKFGSIPIAEKSVRIEDAARVPIIETKNESRRLFFVSRDSFVSTRSASFGAPDRARSTIPQTPKLITKLGGHRREKKTRRDTHEACLMHVLSVSLSV